MQAQAAHAVVSPKPQLTVSLTQQTHTCIQIMRPEDA
jgi:hypothetical protein